ncbi:hypothetical protein Cgig2_002212 [Carnegiea gigantea]|uniref:Uncharacterized protein n=1 Tax=Carnegiea gigantea TaxID=171969 RepID=A0A9Q1GVC1_9CARY|nr:hypothetical protein Cgig2_002212 [Carnegiea gigantea]
MSTTPNPICNPINITNGIIPANSPLRGVAASRMPVTEEYLPELRGLVDSINRCNLVYPPDCATNVSEIVHKPPEYNVTTPVCRFVRERPEHVFREGFRRWEMRKGLKHLWAEMYRSNKVRRPAFPTEYAIPSDNCRRKTDSVGHFPTVRVTAGQRNFRRPMDPSVGISGIDLLKLPECPTE